jgi:hypothetical protein
MKMPPSSFEMDEIPIGDLGAYNQDLDDKVTPPAAWTAFRDAIKAHDAILVVTPVYNRSVPAVRKNAIDAIDVGSRPYGKSVWNGKPGAIASVSPGTLGGFGANHHRRRTSETRERFSTRTANFPPGQRAISCKSSWSRLPCGLRRAPIGPENSGSVRAEPQPAGLLPVFCGRHFILTTVLPVPGGT